MEAGLAWGTGQPGLGSQLCPTRSTSWSPSLDSPILGALILGALGYKDPQLCHLWVTSAQNESHWHRAPGSSGGIRQTRPGPRSPLCQHLSCPTRPTSHSKRFVRAGWTHAAVGTGGRWHLGESGVPVSQQGPSAQS